MIRKARIEDIPAIRQLIDPYGKSGDMLPVSLSELYDRIRSYFLFDHENDGVVGAAALHVTWGPHGTENNGVGSPPIGASSEFPLTGGLAEIRSLAVKKSHQKAGIAKSLIEACIADAPSLGVTRIFVLPTSRSSFACSDSSSWTRPSCPTRYGATASTASISRTAGKPP